MTSCANVCFCFVLERNVRSTEYPYSVLRTPHSKWLACCGCLTNLEHGGLVEGWTGVGRLGRGVGSVGNARERSGTLGQVILRTSGRGEQWNWNFRKVLGHLLCIPEPLESDAAVRTKISLGMQSRCTPYLSGLVGGVVKRPLRAQVPSLLMGTLLRV
jgi:hypothetical protein